MSSSLGSVSDCGYYEKKELRSQGIHPPEERVKRGRVAVIECAQEIPCDPCKFICKFNAIHKRTINTPPKVDWEKCTGCGLCIGVCPGLAIFTIQKKDGKGYIGLPYELFPEPKVGDTVSLLNRKGEEVGRGHVTQILKQKSDVNLTVIVEVLDPDLVFEVRAIKVVDS